ncbi:hypothetical protein AB0K00_33065 [Dactylosporangium sp. NPDC049525]|uniref:zinc ribbon domain-containing protein n=1 Tax=Dactylosporangium sp. NPDC049525 TaxID=3154730 RepID=UPI003424E0C8
MTMRLLAEHWTPEGLALLAAGVGVDDRRLPGKGWMAMRRLGWASTPPSAAGGGLVVSDRVRRIAEEHAARLLRRAVHHDGILRAVVESWPVNPARRTVMEWQALWAAASDGASKVEVRSHTRQAVRFLAGHGQLPRSVTEAEAPPHVSGQVLLAAADRQQVTHARNPADPTRLTLRVLLPAVEHPVSYRDWEWVVLDAAIPASVPARAALLAPTLRVRDGRVRVDLPFTRNAPLVRASGHRRAVGVDWGYNTLLTATTGRLGEDRRGRARVSTTGRPLTFNAAGATAKLLRLRTQREQIRTRLDHYNRLLNGHPNSGAGSCSDVALTAKRDVLAVEHERVCARIRHLGGALAWTAARWTVEHALTEHATAIYIEDLTSMETCGLSRALHRRLGGHIRGQVFDALTHLAAVEGIAVITVPARGTSAGCPRCGRHTATAAIAAPGRRAGFRHVTAPDRPTSRGHKWSVCACGLSSDRDHAAAERIAARGLLSQAHTRRHRKSGQIRTVKTVDGPVRRLPKTRRDQNGPAGRTKFPLMPLRRETPAPATQSAVGQRPAGRTPQTLNISTTSTTGGQVPTTNLRHRRTRDRYANRGFHHHVRATPPRAGTVPRRNLS